MRLPTYLFRDYIDESEEIVAVCHRHPFIFFVDVARLIFFHGVIPGFVWYFFPQIFWIGIVLGVIGFIRVMLVLQDWYYDAWLITSMGIIDIEWTGFFDRCSNRVEYPSIEGISYHIKGPMQIIFNYGSVTLAKLGGPVEITLKEAMNPKKVEMKILKFQEYYMTNKNFQDQEVLKQLLADIVVDHIQKKGLTGEVRKKVRSGPMQRVKDRPIKHS